MIAATPRLFFERNPQLEGKLTLRISTWIVEYPTTFWLTIQLKEDLDCSVGPPAKIISLNGLIIMASVYQIMSFSPPIREFENQISAQPDPSSPNGNPINHHPNCRLTPHPRHRDTPRQLPQSLCNPLIFKNRHLCSRTRANPVETD